MQSVACSVEAYGQETSHLSLPLVATERVTLPRRSTERQWLKLQLCVQGDEPTNSINSQKCNGRTTANDTKVGAVVPSLWY